MHNSLLSNRVRIRGARRHTDRLASIGIKQPDRIVLVGENNLSRGQHIIWRAAVFVHGVVCTEFTREDIFEAIGGDLDNGVVTVFLGLYEVRSL